MNGPLLASNGDPGDFPGSDSKVTVGMALATAAGLAALVALALSLIV